ncbi:hypothetical protein J2Z83_002122 [Virgibacillus natechei]|uniref:Uncharacterized protein n=1 Tax=Virgibacillus natechei TaxID=1216297 RepID=A0ABS4IJ53_9BACI|nr:hypothetical protein [Virgibacillus natechei]MBP1970014.1 hypothetical protein [Virgibacillus natechei]UZD13329.1 hypothetical protein OLD84_01835 [Virgibacillus natechei]
MELAGFLQKTRKPAQRSFYYGGAEVSNIKTNYKDLLSTYDTASKHYEETGSMRLLKHTLENLESFERSFIECYSLGKLMELQSELSAQEMVIV